MGNNDKMKKSILESLAVISVMVVYVAFGVQFIPILMLFIPLPFIILGVRNHIYNNIMGMVFTSIIIQFLMGNTYGTSMVLLFVPLSIVANYCLKYRKNSMESILISTAAFFLSFLLMIFLGQVVSDFNFSKQIESILTQSINAQIEAIKELGASTQEIATITEALEDQSRSILIRIPALLIAISFFTAYINVFIATFILRKMGHNYVPEQKFSTFKLPNNIVPGVGVMLLTAFFLNELKVQYHEALLMNITFLVGFIFIVQWLAVLDYLMVKFRIKPIFRFIILILNIFVFPISTLLFIIGVMDSIFDFRKLRMQRS